MLRTKPKSYERVYWGPDGHPDVSGAFSTKFCRQGGGKQLLQYFSKFQQATVLQYCGCMIRPKRS